MTSTPDTILALNRMVQDAEESAYAAELELAAARAEVLQLREVVASQRQTIEALQHAAVCAHQEYRRVVAERDALVARLTGGAAPDPVWLAARRAELQRRIAESAEREAEHREQARKHLQAATAEADYQAALWARLDLIGALLADGINESAIAAFSLGLVHFGGKWGDALTIPWTRGGELVSIHGAVRFTGSSRWMRRSR